MKLSTQLTVRYIAALSLIAALLSVTYINIQQLIKTQENSALIINISGRQRMLTQKAALDSLKLTNAEEPSRREVLRQDMLHTVAQMEQTYLTLTDKPISPQLEEQLSRYIASVRIWATIPDEQVRGDNSELQYILNAASGPLVHSLDTFVLERQQESERKISAMQEFETGMFITAILVLICEALYIFRPAVNIIETERKELQAVNEELNRQSSMDGLTGIANRRYFDKCLTQAWNKARRDRQELSLIVLDVDCFKLFNDTYGHLAGDDCLRQVAAALKEAAKRPADLAARYGGEEFVLLLPNTPLSGAVSVAEAVRQAVEELGILHENSTAAQVVTVSIGVASSAHDKLVTPETLIAAADEALYEAKRNGRNRVQVNK